MFPVHPASHRKQTLTSASRDTVSFAVCLIIGTLLVCKSSVSLFAGCSMLPTSPLWTYHTPPGGASPARTQAALPQLLRLVRTCMAQARAPCQWGWAGPERAPKVLAQKRVVL